MKIIFLTDYFPPNHLGGAEMVAWQLAKKIQEKGHYVLILTTTQDKNAPLETLFDGLKIYQIYADYPEKWRAYLSLYNPQTVSLIKKIFQKEKPDVVHAHNLHRNLSYYSLKLARKYSQKVFLTAHDVMLFHYGKFYPFKEKPKVSFWALIKRFKFRYNPLRNLIIRHYLKYVDKIFVVSRALENLLTLNGIRNTAVIYNGLDIEKWTAEPKKIKEFKKKYQLEDKKVIFFGGRLSGPKGGEQAILALPEIVAQIPQTVLLVVGKENKYTQKMRQIAREKGVENNLIFTGWLTGEELKSAYWSANLCLIPSVCFDSFPMTALEAMASQKPVVGSIFGGLKEIVIEGQTGYLINPLNIKELAQKIIDLLRNPLKAQDFGRAGMERLKKCFSLEKQAKETLDYYFLNQKIQS